MKRITTFILVALMLLPLAGCSPLAGGSHPELFVVATHSLLGVSGLNREDVIILEEDDFGRVMFAYGGSTIASDRPGATFNILAVLIAQRTTRRYSYFYDGINFILHEIEGDWWPTALEFLSEAFIMEHFSEEQLEQLKEGNSWNEELNEDRFFRVRALRGDKRRHLRTVSEEAQREAFPVSGSFSVLNSVPLTMDRYGNVLYFMRSWAGRSFLVMFDRDGNLIEDTGVMELYDPWDYRDQLREFKEANGWSFYYR